MAHTPDKDDVPSDDDIDGSPEHDPNTVRGTFTRLHPREFFGDAEWERRIQAGETRRSEPEPDRENTEWGLPPPPSDGTGIVDIERRVDMDAWAADWIGPVVDGMVTTGLAGPHSGTLEECVAWALKETRPARITIYLV